MLKKKKKKREKAIKAISACNPDDRALHWMLLTIPSRKRKKGYRGSNSLLRDCGKTSDYFIIHGRV